VNASQPLDKILMDLKLTNAALVKASQEQLTCKQVQKARKGKNITPNIQGKVLRALNLCARGGKYRSSDLFAETSPEGAAITTKGNGHAGPET
jgi:hypothetical protein